MKPTFISKVNTALQFALIGATLATPVFSSAIATPDWLTALQWTVGGTTLASTISYMFVKDTVRFLRHRAADTKQRLRTRAQNLKGKVMMARRRKHDRGSDSTGGSGTS